MAKIPINLSSGNIEEQKKVPPVIVGIDLGTTHSLVAYVKSGKPEILKKDGNSGLVPSVIHFSDDGTIVVGHKADGMGDMSRTITSVKRLMGKSILDLGNYLENLSYEVIGNKDDEEKLLQVKIGQSYHNPISLSAEILKSLKSTAEELLGTPVEKAVITVPAYFNDSQRQATRDAGKLAGLNVLRIINEPTAASLAYGVGTTLEEQENIAVYDLGGGTFDISILNVDKGIFEVLSTHGDTFLGGDDIDFSIAQRWIRHNPELEPFKNVLKVMAEQAKIVVSQGNSYQERVDGRHEIFLDRAELDDIVKPFIDRTIESCAQALQDSGLAKNEIHKVILVGGSTRLPQVKSAVSEFFDCEINDSVHPDEVVALGAAVQADILAGNRKDILLLDVTPLSLGIETVGGLMDVIISRNSKVPIGAGRNYTTSVDGQTKLRISIFQGERDLVEHNRKLGECILSDIPPMAAGIPKIEVKLILDADGILTVNATELRTGVATRVQIQSQYGVTEEEMAKMLIDSIQHAESDMKSRALIEVQTEAKMVVASTGKFLAQNKHWLSEMHIELLQNAKEELRRSLESQDKDAIQDTLDRVNAMSRPLAEEALDRAVSDNLRGEKV